MPMQDSITNYFEELVNANNIQHPGLGWVSAKIITESEIDAMIIEAKKEKEAAEKRIQYLENIA